MTTTSTNSAGPSKVGHDVEKSEDSMTAPSAVSLREAATLFVVQDVLRSVEHYRDALGFQVDFTYGEPTFYAGVERDNVAIHLQAASETKRHPGTARSTCSSPGWTRSTRS